MHDESSSSANAKTEFLLHKTEWASPGLLKVFPEDGPSFFVRDIYLPFPAARLLEPCASFNGEAFDQLLAGARIWLAEKTAMAYLARAEHCRRQLEIKLLKKGYVEQEIVPALDYLEEKNYLDDSRFCEAWLRNRLLHKAEGSIKLLAGLQNRGIDHETAKKAVLAALDGSEEERLCKKVVERFEKKGKTGAKLVSALNRAGFSFKIVAKCIKYGENNYYT